MARGSVLGLPGSGAWAFLARCLLSGREIPSFEPPAFTGPLVFVRRETEELEDIADAFRALAPLFGGPELSVAAFGEDARARLGSLELLRGGARLVLATPEALAKGLPSPADFSRGRVAFKVGGILKRAEVSERLAEAGYARVDFVESPGEFAVRGAVLDFYGLEPLKAVRVLFDEDTVASLRAFDCSTQATLELLGEAQAVPAAEPESGAGLSAWLGEDSLWIAETGLEASVPQNARLLSAGLSTAKASELDFGARAHTPCHGRHELAWEEMLSRHKDGWRVLLYSLNRGEDSRVQELLEEKLPPGACQFLIGPLRQGFQHPGLKLAVMATSEIFGRHYRAAARWKHFEGGTRAGLRWRELRQGDYVVHQDYGIARYRGLAPVESPGHGTLDCLVLEFRGSDTLYVPMTEFGRVQKYSGAEGKRPRLCSLDTRRWEEVKRLVKEGVRELAEKLLKIQAERASRPGFAFPTATAMEREFAAAFPYEETPDQSRAISEVLDDMSQNAPMDRVVIGDVGFGKTEVAMRAAFKCVAGFKQAAILAPTTILAEQHYRTFSGRFADYPVRLAVLTRFQRPAQVRSTLEGLRQGIVDVVIGTSRLLQRDVAFKDLGLAVIDEEHRFGVKDKERLKSFRSTVDVLALSATPIPRTLNQALSGLRAISLIESAPAGRQPIVTKVGPWDGEVVAAALAEELARGGQAYYVHNRVRTLEECARSLRESVPQARFAVVHGQMRGSDIEKTMWDFFHKKFDVLVASTIIESGLDIPSVNTLLVEDAHEFGLAQLYQIRGRIGRERARAYCYLFYSHEAGGEALSDEARKRLEALREFAELGAGYKLAMRDLEIRGAGELLGARQHGFMNAVGAEYYSELLDSEISRRKGGGAVEAAPEVSIDIRLPAFIPEDYLPGELERLEFYKRILRSRPEEHPALLAELADLSGPAPGPVRNLFSVLKIRALALKAGIRSVTQKEGRIEVYFRKGAAVEPGSLARWTGLYGKRLKFIPSSEGDGLSVELSESAALEWLEEFLPGVLGRPAKKC